MSRERELLQEFIEFVDSYEFYTPDRNVIWEIATRATNLLAQRATPPERITNNTFISNSQYRDRS